MKNLNCDKKKITEICSYGSNWHYPSIGSDNGLVPNRQFMILIPFVGISFRYIIHIINGFAPNRRQDIILTHYSDITMSAMASEITSLTIVYSTVYSGADQRKDQSSASLAFVRGIHRWPVHSPHKGPVTRKMFPFDGVIMTNDGLVYWRFYASHGLSESMVFLHLNQNQGWPIFNFSFVIRKQLFQDLPPIVQYMLHVSPILWCSFWAPCSPISRGRSCGYMIPILFVGI